jgi:DNA-binding MarR family transcriptional regulator
LTGQDRAYNAYVTTPAQRDAPAPAIDELLSDRRITAIGLLEEVAGGLAAKLASQYAEHDLTGAEFQVLVRLARSPNRELRMSDLAAQTQLTTSGITRVVDRLEADGLVARRACPTDRRGSFAGVSRASTPCCPDTSTCLRSGSQACSRPLSSIRCCARSA